MHVTGKHGTALHRGNVFTRIEDGELTVDFKRGANVTNLSGYFDTKRYLTNSSDIVALLVLEHQTAMQNTITSAGMHSRRMLEYQQTLQKELKETSTEELAYDSVRSVFKGAVQDLVDDLLFRGEAAMPAGLEGAPGFQSAFQRNARRDAGGRSLKDFSLQGHLFQNRCSYLIYSDSFLALPELLKKRVYARLQEILDAPQAEPRYAYLGRGERARIPGDSPRHTSRVSEIPRRPGRTLIARTSRARDCQQHPQNSLSFRPWLDYPAGVRKLCMTPKLFSELGLSAEVLKAIDKLGFEQAAPIQAAAIPAADGGQGRRGPIADRLRQDRRVRHSRRRESGSRTSAPCRC